MTILAVEREPITPARCGSFDDTVALSAEICYFGLASIEPGAHVLACIFIIGYQEACAPFLPAVCGRIVSGAAPGADGVSCLSAGEDVTK